MSLEGGCAVHIRLDSQPAVATNTAKPATPRLVLAAQEFEAQMMKELMKPMTSLNASQDGESEGGATGAVGEFAAEALAQAISRHGGFGVADRIIRSLSQTGPRIPIGKAAASGTRNLQ
jgi:flagellar protein FlgJ